MMGIQPGNYLYRSNGLSPLIMASLIRSLVFVFFLGGSKDGSSYSNDSCTAISSSVGSLSPSSVWIWIPFA